MQNFLDVILPPVLLLVLTAGVLAAAAVITTGRLRLYAAQRRDIDIKRQSLQASRDVMATIISDAATPDFVRNAAVTAYEQLGAIMNSQKKELN